MIGKEQLIKLTYSTTESDGSSRHQPPGGVGDSDGFQRPAPPSKNDSKHWHNKPNRAHASIVTSSQSRIAPNDNKSIGKIAMM